MASQAFHIAQPPVGETLNSGSQTVPSAGTAVALVSSSTPCIEVLVQAQRTNTGRIYIGGADVLNDDSNGVYITAGQSLPITAQNLTQVYINATANDDGVTFIYW